MRRGRSRPGNGRGIEREGRNTAVRAARSDQDGAEEHRKPDPRAGERFATGEPESRLRLARNRLAKGRARRPDRFGRRIPPRSGRAIQRKRNAGTRGEGDAATAPGSRVAGAEVRAPRALRSRSIRRQGQGRGQKGEKERDDAEGLHGSGIGGDRATRIGTRPRKSTLLRGAWVKRGSGFSLGPCDKFASTRFEIFP